MPARIPVLLLCLALALSPCVPASAMPSSEDAALTEAQELLAWAYGLNAATLSLFRLMVEETPEGGWRITYTGDMPYPEPLGEYTVALYPDAPADIRWSYDEAWLPAFSGDLDAPIWSQPQLRQAYDAIVRPPRPGLAPLSWREKPQSEFTHAAPVLPGPIMLPEGSLAGQAQAVADFLASGALETQSAAVKADIVQRIFEAGLESALPEDAPVYVAPGPGDLPEEEALAVARAALLDAYGFTGACFPLFDVFYSLTAQPDGRYWTLAFLPKESAFAPFPELLPCLGSYRVRLDAAYGELRYAVWSLDGQNAGLSYTEQTWGHLYLLALRAQPEALSARMLPWVAELLEDLAAAADAPARDALLRAAGFPRSRFPLGQPGPEDITPGDAVFSARRLLLSRLGLAPELVRDAVFQAAYTVSSPAGPRWEVLCFLDDGELTATYAVYLHPATGAVLTTQCLTGGSG